MKNLLFAALLVVVPTATLAQIYIRERFVVDVVPLTQTEFEVVENLQGGRDLVWCAAGIYGKRILGQPRSDLWVADAIGPSKVAPGRKSVIFTIVPLENDSTGWTFKTDQVGYRKSGLAARDVCDPRRRYVLIRVNGQLVSDW